VRLSGSAARFDLKNVFEIGAEQPGTGEKLWVSGLGESNSIHWAAFLRKQNGIKKEYLIRFSI